MLVKRVVDLRKFTRQLWNDEEGACNHKVLAVWRLRVRQSQVVPGNGKRVVDHPQSDIVVCNRKLAVVER